MKKIILFLVFLLYPLLVSAQPSTTSIIAVSDDDVTVYTNHIGFIGADVNKAGYKAIVNIQSSSDTRYLKLDGSSTTTASIPFAEGLSVGDANTTLTKDGSNNMLFTDAVSGSKTLAQLLDPEADMYWWDGDSWEPWDKSVGATINSGTSVIGQVQISGGEGTGTDTSLTLTNATTAYALPSSAPTVPYRLIMYNVSDTDMYVRDSTGTTLGTLYPAGAVWTEDMGASEVKYLYCGSAGKIVNYSTKASQ